MLLRDDVGVLALRFAARAECGATQWVLEIAPEVDWAGEIRRGAGEADAEERGRFARIAKRSPREVTYDVLDHGGRELGLVSYTARSSRSHAAPAVVVGSVYGERLSPPSADGAASRRLLRPLVATRASAKKVLASSLGAAPM